MKRNTCITLIVLSLALSPTGLSAEDKVRVDESKYREEIDKRFSKVKGFSTVLVSHNFTLARSNGIAQPGHAMTWDTYANVGSVKKFVAGLLLLRVLEQKHGTRDLGSFLNNRIYNYMPQVIRNSVPESNKKITLRDLIQHKSGLRTEHSSGNPFHDLLKPIKASDYGKREYSNTNYKLLTYLIPLIVDPALKTKAEQEAAKRKWSATDPNLQRLLGHNYHFYVLTHLLNEAEPNPAFGTPHPRRDVLQQNREVALMYTSKSDQQPGELYDQIDEVGHAKAMGGWYFSARDLARLVRNLGSENDGVISQEIYNLLYLPQGSAAARDQRYVWPSEMPNSYLESRFGWKASPYHGGSDTVKRDSGSTTYARAAIIRLPGGFHAVGIVNSEEMSSYEVAKSLQHAFAESIK